MVVAAFVFAHLAGEPGLGFHVHLAFEHFHLDFVLVGFLDVPADVLVAYREVAVFAHQTLVVDLESEGGVEDGELKRVDHPPIEGAVPALDTIVDIGVLDLAVELARHEQVHHVREIMLVGPDIRAPPDDHPHLEVRARCRFYVELLTSHEPTL